MSRRQALGVLAGAGFTGFAALGGFPGAVHAAGSTLPADLTAKFADPAWGLKTLLRIEGDTRPGTQIHGFNTGTVLGVRDGEPLRPLFGFEVFSSIRLIPQSDGTYQRLCRELVFYRDLATGKMLDEWTNVYTGEKVKVVDVANDPYNYYLTPRGPQSDKSDVHSEPAGRSQRWFMLNEDTVAFERDVHLFYPSMLTPEKWPRESPGKMTRVTEFMRFAFRLEDILNEKLTHLPHAGTWGRVTPWLPWMLMDQAPGHIVYMGMFSTRHAPSGFAPEVLARVKERYPSYLNAPEKWGGKSYSSLERYALEQKPAPPRKPTGT